MVHGLQFQNLRPSACTQIYASGLGDVHEVSMLTYAQVPLVDQAYFRCLHRTFNKILPIRQSAFGIPKHLHKHRQYRRSGEIRFQKLYLRNSKKHARCDLLWQLLLRDVIIWWHSLGLVYPHAHKSIPLVVYWESEGRMEPFSSIYIFHRTPPGIFFCCYASITTEWPKGIYIPHRLKI